MAGKSFIQKYLRKIPGVDELLKQNSVVRYLSRYPRELVVDGIRVALDDVRKLILQAENEEEAAGALDKLFSSLDKRIKQISEFHLKPLVNATGVVLHTNLGRAPLAEEAIERIAEVSRGYSNLEYDLDCGKRGSRYSHVENLLKKICGVEAAFVVNNNASAVLLALNTLASGKEVIVSRGEMIEIGGSFRIPEIMKISGAKLVEVGTTNKTHLKDYEEAITENTGLILKVHPSNYRVIGFTKEAELEELVALGEKFGIPVMYDAGSGALIEFSRFNFPEEPSIQRAVESGAHIITFSGDKLLGGPQAGIIVGRSDYVNAMKKNHLNRALRIDKLTLAALEATLRFYLEEDGWKKVPALRMLTEPPEEVKKRARKLYSAIKKEFGKSVEIKVVKTKAQSGGGALPGVLIDSFGVALKSPKMKPNEIERALRFTEPPVIHLIQDDSVIFEARTLLKGDEKRIVSALKQIGL